MNGSQLMGLDSVGIDRYDIHGYFRELTVGQRTPRLWVVTFLISYLFCISNSNSHSLLISFIIMVVIDMILMDLWVVMIS